VFALLVSTLAVTATVYVQIMMVLAAVAMVSVTYVRLGFIRDVLVAQHVVISSANPAISMVALVITIQFWKLVFARQELMQAAGAR
jgi:hypothetical protein